MDHQSFRFYIPGILFLLPIYIVTCWITICYYSDSDIRVFVLLGGITTFPVIALPTGWWIYNAYRVWWVFMTKGGYENKDFVKLIRDDTKPFYSPLTGSILIDFSHIKDIESWIKIELDLFRKAFYPFTSKTRFNKDIEQKGVNPKFTESISDYILFKDKGYDYARSISSVRYGFESGVFALGLGGLYSYGLKTIWLYELNLTNNRPAFIICVCLLLMLTIFILITLFIRWKRADKEYDARLILTTLTSLKSNYFNPQLFEDKIINEVVDSINQLNVYRNPYAAFDLDNTLLIGDIGEAVFAAMVKKNIIKNFTWKDYLILLKQNREAGYKKVIEVMNGLELKVLKQITHEIINSESTSIELEGEIIPIPKPNSMMQAIISLLKIKGIEVYVVTASSKISSEIVCWEYFGIPSNNILGASVSTNSKGKIFTDITEIPYAEGKVTALKRLFKNKPVITGGDGAWDKYLLDYTTPDGIRLWLGKDKNEYQSIKDSFYNDLHFYKIPTS